MNIRMVMGLATFLMTATAWPQTGNLREDLRRLQIRHRTEHYAISGTVSDERLAEYGRCLEYIYHEYATGFAELLQDSSKDKRATFRPSRAVVSGGRDDRFRVVIFTTDAEYKEFGSRYFGGRVEHTRGMYVSSAQLLFLRDEVLPAQTFRTLFHEAFHQFIDRHIPRVPTWLNEGLATYYGTVRVTPGGLVFDRPQSGFFQVVRNAVSARMLIPLDELMLSSRREFYSRAPVKGLSADRTTLSYAQSYTLVAYMLADPYGVEHLRRYLRELARAGTVAEVGAVTRQVFPDSLLSTMVPEWLTYVNRY